MIMEEFENWVTRLHQSRSPEIRILMSIKQMIRFNVYNVLAVKKINFFWTDTPKAFDYAELTPYNKGCLWKIRIFLDDHCAVYYGTVKKAWCTTIHDAIKFIPKP